MSFYFPLKNNQRSKGLVTSLGLKNQELKWEVLGQVSEVEVSVYSTLASLNYTSQSAPAAANQLLNQLLFKH